MKGGIAGGSGAELKPIRIFVCSSGDMIAERQAALRVVEAINRAAQDEARLEPYLWEENAHRFEGAQSYQGNIPLPAEFDIFLGFLFSRIGSRLTEEEYRRDLSTKVANFSASSASDDTAAPDLMALTQLTADLPLERLPTGTTFEIINARDAAQRRGGHGRPCLWLAVNGAIPEGLTSRDGNIAEPVRQRWYEVSQFVEDELNARHVPITSYGVDVRRAQQLMPGGLQEFEDLLEAWLTNTLATRFGLRLSWAERAYVGLRPFAPEESSIFLGRRASIAEALGRLDQLAREGPRPMLLLTGPSGAGKSSFSRAGLIGHLGAYRLHRRRTEGALFVAQLVRTWRHLAVRPAELGEACPMLRAQHRAWRGIHPPDPRRARRVSRPLFFVQPVNPLAVDRVTLAPQQHPKASIAKPPALLSQRFQPRAADCHRTVGAGSGRSTGPRQPHGTPAARSSRTRLADEPPPRGQQRASPFFSKQVLQRRVVEHRVRQQPLQLGVLHFQSPQPLRSPR
jgi:hypothetical protein